MKLLDIALLHVPPRRVRGARDETAKLPIRLGSMRKQQQLVRRVKAHQIARRPPRAEQVAQARVREYPLDEVVAQSWIGQPPFFLERQMRKSLDERHGKQTAARRVPQLRGRRRSSPARVRSSASPSSGRKPDRSSCARADARDREKRSIDAVTSMPLLTVISRNRRSARDDPHGLARRAETAFDFRTDRHPLDEAAEGLGQKRIAFVTAVEAHLVPEQARGDADANRPRPAIGGDIRAARLSYAQCKSACL